MNNMAWYGVFGTDVAKERIAYYSDQIYLYGTDLNAVMTGSEAWARTELSKVIDKRLFALKDQWFLTSEKYDGYIKSYSGAITAETPVQLGGIYKDFLRFEKEVRDTAIPGMQDALYEKFKTKLAAMLKANLITQEKHDMWLVKIGIQVYQYKSDPDFMAEAFDEEAARYTTPIVPCAPCSTSCTWGAPTTSCANPELITGDYTTLVKNQYGKKYAKMSQKNLEMTLVRTKKLGKKYKEGSKDKLKNDAMIDLLNLEIGKKKYAVKTK